MSIIGRERPVQAGGGGFVGGHARGAFLALGRPGGRHAPAAPGKSSDSRGPRPWRTTAECRGAIPRPRPSAAWPAARRPPRADRSPTAPARTRSSSASSSREFSALLRPPARCTSWPIFSSSVIFLSSASGRRRLCATAWPAQDKKATSKAGHGGVASEARQEQISPVRCPESTRSDRAVSLDTRRIAVILAQAMPEESATLARMRPMTILLAAACAAWRRPGLAAEPASRRRARPCRPPISSRLAAARIPADAAAVVVKPLDGGALSWSANDKKPMNPASTMKLVTTYSALHLLGPAFTFRTEMLSEAPVLGEALRGDLYVRGGGDPQARHRRPVAAGQPAARLRHPRDPRRRGARQDLLRAAQARSGANSTARKAAPTTSGPTRCCVNFKSIAITLRARPASRRWRAWSSCRKSRASRRRAPCRRSKAAAATGAAGCRPTSTTR